MLSYWKIPIASGEDSAPSPWAVVTDTEKQTFYSLPDSDRCETILRNQVIGQSYGWTILRRPDTDDRGLCLWNSATLQTINLPTLDDQLSADTNRAVLTLPPHHPNSRVVIIDHTKPLLAHCKPKTDQIDNPTAWIVQEISGELARFRAAGYWDQAVCGGKLYTMTVDCQTGGNKLFEIQSNDDDDNVLVATMVADDGGRELMPNCRSYDRGLVDLDGELVQVLVCSFGTSGDDLQFVLVYKLDRSSSSVANWVPLRTLGGRSIFLCPNHAFSLSSSSCSMIKPNCIYRFHGEFEPFVFDVERGESSFATLPSVSPRKTGFSSNFGTVKPDRDDLKPMKTGDLIRPIPPRKAIVWFLNRFGHWFRPKEAEAEEEEEENRALILKLPLDIHFNIANRHLLSVGDYRNYRESCRAFRLASPLPSSSHPLKSPAYPWFFFFSGCYKTEFKLHDLRCRNDFPSRLPESLSGSYIVLSKHRWLVAMKYDSVGWKFHIYNPFGRLVRSVPAMPAPSKAGFSIGMSGPPDSTQCFLVGAWQYSDREVRIKLLRLHDEDRGWQSFRFEAVGFRFRLSVNTSPAFLAGRFYFLDEELRLGVFSYDQTDDGRLELGWVGYSWNRLDKCGGGDLTKWKSKYLVECGGKILAVMTDRIGESVRVYVFDQDRTGWSEVTDLGCQMIFVSHACCFATAAKFPEMGNKIYFPRLSIKGSIVFYSLETCKYHTFDGDAMDDFRPTRHVHLSGWIEPPS